MLEELHFCCVKHNNKWNYLLHYYNFNGKNAKHTKLTGGGGTDTRGRRTPYSGNYRGAAWNAQALFIVGHERTHHARWAYVNKLISTHDFVILTETHSTKGSIR